MKSPSLRTLQVSRLRGGALSGHDDELVGEEPLEIRLAGDTLAVTMRTPGHDRELALGFLYAEGLIQSVDQVGSVAYCGRPGDAARTNTLEVTPSAGTKIDVDKVSAARRGTLTTAACGVCGRRSIEDLLARCTAVVRPERVSAKAIFAAMEALERGQSTFARSGGCHGAAAAHLDGTLAAAFEDVGRHNAVDKVVGSLLLSRALPATQHMLVVSGRVSFEIVQKAVAAGIPAVAGVSAASSLAVDLAKEAGVTLAGFVRHGGLTVYAGDVDL